MAAAKIDARCKSNDVPDAPSPSSIDAPRRHAEKLCVLAISAPTCPSTLLLIKLRRHAGNRDEFISPPIVPPPFSDNFTFRNETSNPREQKFFRLCFQDIRFRIDPEIFILSPILRVFFSNLPADFNFSPTSKEVEQNFERNRERGGEGDREEIRIPRIEGADSGEKGGRGAR